MFNIVFELHKELLPNHAYRTIPKNSETRKKIFHDLIRSIGQEFNMTLLNGFNIQFIAELAYPSSQVNLSRNNYTTNYVLSIPSLWLTTHDELQNFHNSITSTGQRLSLADRFQVTMETQFYSKFSKNVEKAKKAVHFVLAQQLVHLKIDTWKVSQIKVLACVLGGILTAIGLAKEEFPFLFISVASTVAALAIVTFINFKILKRFNLKVDEMTLKNNEELAVGAIYFNKKYKSLKQYLADNYILLRIADYLNISEPSESERIHHARRYLQN